MGLHLSFAKSRVYKMAGIIYVRCIIAYYYQYARPNDKLPSVKRAFLRAKRECAG